jgi:hypothetical protein
VIPADLSFNMNNSNIDPKNLMAVKRATTALLER